MRPAYRGERTNYLTCASSATPRRPPSGRGSGCAHPFVAASGAGRRAETRVPDPGPQLFPALAGHGAEPYRARPGVAIDLREGGLATGGDDLVDLGGDEDDLERLRIADEARLTEEV